MKYCFTLLLTLSSYYAFSQCLVSSTMTATPPPPAMGYMPGDVVTFCYTIDSWNTLGANWIHGIEISLAPGWDASTLAPVTVPNSCNSNGEWGWYTGVIGQGSSGCTTNAGPGFYYDSPSGGPQDGDPGNNWGDSCGSGNSFHTACFTVTVGPCQGLPSLNLDIFINTHADSETGTWSSCGCENDVTEAFNYSGLCCDDPELTWTNVSCNGDTDGSFTVNGIGTAPFEYAWSGPMNGIVSNQVGPHTESNLPAGNYILFVTDNAMCTVDTSFTIAEPDALALSFTTADVTCNGAFDASITTSVTGGTGTYTFDWDQLQDVQSPSGIGPGTFFLTVTDANMCMTTGSATISEPPPLSASAVGDAVLCSGDTDGDIDLTFNGGIMPYTYQWDNGAGTDEDPTGLGSGIYTVTITDANNCIATASAEITEPPMLTATAVGDAVGCMGDMSGDIDLTPLGGTSPYTYQWDNGAGTDEDPSGLGVGTYSVTITDANTCSITLSAEVTEPNQLQVGGGANALDCFGDTDGTIDITVSGGTLPYTYNWDNGAGTDEDPSGLGQGLYTVTVTDANGCMETHSAFIFEPTLLTASASLIQNVSCFFGMDGSASVTAGGGTMPYTYTWDNGETEATATALNMGLHIVTVTDASGCTETSSVTLTEPFILIASAFGEALNCTGDTDGNIDLIVFGGVSPYTYIWSNGATVEDPGGLGLGNYQVTVTDGNGCTVQTDGDITGPPGGLEASATDGSVLCAGDTDGTIDLTTSGGTPPYAYNWDNGAGTDEDPTGLSAGTYTVTITDGNNCTLTASAQVTEPAAMTINVSLNQNVTCSGFSDGSASASPTGGAMPYTYLWDNGETDATGIMLNANIHIVTVTDANMCTATGSITITENAALLASAVGETLNCNGDIDGNIDLSVMAGLMPYTFAWDNGAGTNEDPSGLSAGTYTVTITDANMCTTTASATILEPSAVSATANGEILACNGDSDGDIDLTVNGGTPPYTYTWDNSAGTDEDPSGLGAGTYSVTITDASSCTFTASAQILEPPALTASSTGETLGCNGDNDGNISLTVSGGTAPYTYSWDNGAGTDEDPSGLIVGVYSVTITDANMCMATSSAQIFEPTLLTSSASGETLDCNGDTDGNIDLTVAGGTPPYTYSWDNGAGTDEDPSGLGAGTYSVTVTDANMCVSIASAIIDQPAGMTASATGETLLCNGDADGDIDLTLSGGSLPYTFAWDNGAGTNEDPSGLSVGTYTVTITDANMCSVTAAADILEPSLLSVAAALINDVTCNGGSDGSASAAGLGGVPPYTYDWDNGEMGPVAVNLSNGIHVVTITDANMCTATTSLTINEPMMLTASAVGESLACNGDSDGNIDLTVNGGTAPYLYIWDNGAGTDEDPSGLSAGTYCVTITDTNNCTTQTCADITEPPTLLSLIVNSTTPANCTSCDGTADMTITGGVPPYIIVWSNGNTSEDPTDLCSGNNFVTVTDNAGCVMTSLAAVGNTSTLVISSTTIDSNVSCNGLSDGAATASVAGGQAPYTYSWDNGSTLPSAAGLAAGNYGITVTDFDGCIAVDNIVITEPTVLIGNAIGETVDCNGDTDGNIDLTVLGGTAPYTFTWDNGAGTDEDPSSLSAGTYSVTITDINMCTTITTAEIFEPSLLAVSASGETLLCNGDSDGDIDLTVSGGTAPYTFTWDNGAGTNEDPSGLSAGIYSVTVTDTNLCTSTASAAISEPSQLMATAIGEALLCNGNTDGDIDLTVNGGTMPYTYSWDNGAGTNEDPSGLSVGTYAVTITDANMCEITASAQITEPAALMASATGELILCNGGTDGDIDLTVSGGTMPYTYSWDNGAGTDEDPSGLSAGVYIVTVTDANMCTVTAITGITEPTAVAITIDATTPANCTSCDGIAQISVSGATPPYTFLWANGNTNEDPDDLCTGSNTVTVTDSNGCTAVATANIGNTSSLVIDMTTVDADVSCNGFNDGQATTSPSGGQAPYTFAWSNGSSDATATGLIAGLYDVTVTDGDGCVAVDNVTISEPPVLQLSLTLNSDISCNGANDGNATANPSGGTPPYTYEWDNGVTDITAANLDGGNHSVTLTDNNGCSVVDNISIAEPVILSSVANLLSNVSCNGGSDGSAEVIAAGGTMPYTYMWDNAETTAIATNLNAGTHDVTVTDQNGCQSVSSVNITEPVALSAIIDSFTDANCTSCDGTAAMTIAGGIPPYAISWSNGNTNEDPSDLCSGNNSVTITDGNNCSTIVSVMIGNVSTLVIDNITVDMEVSCNGGSDGQATATISGGEMPYVYNWSNGSTDATISGVPSGLYTLTVSDADGCIETDNVIINEPSAITNFSNVSNNVSCNGFSDGSAEVISIGGTPPYTYLWDNGETDANATALNAGIHTVTITDNNNCMTTASVTLTEPGVLTSVVDGFTDANCISCDGTASISVFGGTLPYTFLWDNGNTTEDPTDLCAGMNNITVTDANGCEAFNMVAITAVSTLVIDNFQIDSNVSCNGFADGAASIMISGGQLPYTYIWTNSSTIGSASGLPAGPISVTVTDADGCEVSDNGLITQPAGITLFSNTLTNVTCNGEADGSAEVLPIGGTPPYTYNWDSGSTDQTATNLNAGLHVVTVTDSNSCEETSSVTITEPTLLTTSTNLLNDVSCNGFSDGSAEVIANGGTMPYTYNWENGETDATAISLNAGNHSVTVTDQNGCISTTSVIVSQPDVLTVSLASSAPANCLSCDGTADAIVSGGTMPYTFLWTNGNTSEDPIDLCTGINDITVTDANGCVATATVNTGNVSTLQLDGVTVDNEVSCNGGNNGQATVTTSSGEMPYTYNWSSGATDATATGLTAGNFDVTVTDADGCEVIGSVTISEPTPVDLSINVLNNISCNGETDGSAEVIANGGTAPYTYLWNTGETEATANMLFSGSNIITVTDANGCTATSATFILEPAALTTLSNVISQVSCNGFSDGSAQVVVIGGTAPYTYNWDSGETDDTATMLSVGQQNVTVTDTNGCETTTFVTLTEPTALGISVDGTTVANCISCDGTASISVSGGVLPYTFLWSNGNTNEDPTDLCAGGNSVTVTDTNGCEIIANAMVSNTSTLVVDNINIDSQVSCNGLSDGQATVTASGGQPPYTFNWSNSVTDAVNPGLNAGNYTVTVTDGDGCIAVDNVTITEPSTLLLLANTLTNVNCNGFSDGSAEVLPIGGTMPYTYNWDNGETTAIANSLDADMHDVTVTDANGCTETTSVVITEPSALNAVTNLLSNISCNGETDGSAEVLPSGGTMPYTFLWSNGETDATAALLGPGNADVTVTDTNNCTIVASVLIIEPTILTVGTILISDANCTGSADGAAQALPSGGIMPYTFNWDSGETSVIAVNLNAGTHIVTISDANGCTETASVLIDEPPQLNVVVDGTTTANCTSCDGSADITPSGGTMPYIYTWSNGSTSEDPQDLCSGGNVVTVTDANGCMVTATANVGNTSTLVVDNITVDNNVSCNGLSDGQVTVSASGGQPPYNFVWSNAVTDAVNPGLSAGNYSVTVTDFDGCVAVDNVTIIEPDVLVANVSEDQPVLCNGDATGLATIAPTGGTTPYTFEWDNGVTDASATNLDAGVHTITLTDANGCSTTSSVMINQPANAISITLDGQTNSNCISCDGSASISVSGGTAPYTYNWDNGNISEDPVDLCAGFNNLTVTDMNGCTETLSINIGNTSTLTIDAVTEDQAVSCFGFSDGTASVTVSLGQQPYTFSWSNGSTDNNATGLPSGMVTVTVTDTDGCTTAGGVMITEPAELTALAVEDIPVSCFGLSDGQATVTAFGGTLPYSFLWNSGETTATALACPAGIGSVTVTDANLCTVITTVEITEPDELMASAIEDQPALCAGDSNGQATVSLTGGTMPYTYTWDSGETDAAAVNLDAGDHTVTITDANGCTTETTVNITEPLPLTGTASEDSPTSCVGSSDGQATVIPDGGILPYTFAWDSGETDETAVNLDLGTHTVTITDMNGCTFAATVDITEPPLLTVSAVQGQPVSCNGFSDGQALATPAGGTSPYTYLWDSGETNDLAVLLDAGMHSVTVTDNNGCTAETTVVITEPLAISLSAIQDMGVSCNGLSDGQATVTASGGTMPYTYNWDNGETDATANNLDAGMHSVTVTDLNGCSLETTVDITQPDMLFAFALEDIPVDCNGAATGQASASGTGGTMPYTYSWPSAGSDAIETDLVAGNHTVTITDANGCTAEATVTINEPPALAAALTSVPVSCFGFPDGQASAIVSGGAPPYFYNWDNGEVSNPAMFLTAGTHVLTITDSNGCELTASVDVDSPDPLIPDNIGSSPTTCFGGDDGSAFVSAAGGTAPYTYTWSDGQTGANATGLTAGVISVVIEDVNGCSLPPINVTVGQPAQSVMVSTTGTDPSCFGGDDGTATASATGGTPSYQFTWSNGAVGPTAFDLEAGTYTVTVEDANGCEMTETITLGQPDPVIAELSSTGALCFGEANGSIVVDTAYGGFGPYVYSLDGENFQTGELFAGLTGGLYEVWVQDINGCESSQEVLVDEPFEITVNLGGDIEVVLGDSITLAAEVNTSDSLSYFWSPANYLSCVTCENPVVYPLETTTYTLMVADSNGCTAIDEITIDVDKSRNVFIPNAFSPNGDGVNDIFHIFSNQGVAQVRMFRVFDRWGEMVFQASNFQPNNPIFGWNGSLKGKGLNPGVFVYFAEVEFVDGVTIMYKGDVTLVK